MSSAVADIKATNDSGPAFWKAVGIPARGPALHEALQQGIPYATYGKLASAAGLDRKELMKVTSSIALPKCSMPPPTCLKVTGIRRGNGC